MTASGENQHESTFLVTEQQQQQQQQQLMYPQLTAEQKNRRGSQGNAANHNRSSATTPTIDDELVQAKQAEEEQRREEYINSRDSLLRSLQASSQLLSRLRQQCLQQSWFRYPPPEVYQPRILNIELQQQPSSRSSEPLLHPTTLLQSLEPASIQNLLIRRVQFSEQHLERLGRRAQDSTSKVLVTGDLNSGKSTLINALLRRDLLPHDQQPCTSAFCEVLHASLNGGVEEVHGIIDPQRYRLDDPSTYRRYPLTFMQSMVGTDEMEKFVVWKVYCKPATNEDANILRNGVIDVTFIDSPGLNSDSIKTMAVFGQQEEIDAIVFVLNSENHFTQSAAEFLAEARKEKPYIFVVGNRFDLIGDKKRCKKQIEVFGRQLLPATFTGSEENGDLVHFISAREFIAGKTAACTNDHDLNTTTASTTNGSGGEYVNSFLRMEASLRCFLLDKRTQSKLIPIKTYLFNLITDLQRLAVFNNQLAQEQLQRADAELEAIAPVYHRLVAFQKNYSDHAEHCRQELLQSTRSEGRNCLERWVSNVGTIGKRVEYPGLLRTMSFARRLLDLYTTSLSETVFNYEHDALSVGMTKITELHEMAGKSVPDWSQLLPLDNLFDLTTIESTPSIEISPATTSGGDVIIEIKQQQQQAEDDSAEDFKKGKLIKVDLEMSDFIETPSTEVLVSTATVAAMGTITAGMVGYHRVAGALWQACQAVGLNSAMKIMAAGAAIAGIGGTLYVLSDVENVVRRKVARKVRRNVRRSERVQRRVLRTCQKVNCRMDKAVFELKKNVCKSVEQFNERCESVVEKKVTSERSKQTTLSLVADCQTIIDELQRI